MEFKRYQTYFFLGICAIVLALIYLVFRPYLELMVFAGVLAILTWPAHKFLTRMFRGSKTVAAVVTVLLTLFFILLPFVIVIVTLAGEIIDVFNRVRSDVSFADLEAGLGRLIGPDVAARIASESARAIANVADYVNPAFTAITSNIVNLFSNTVAIFFGIVLVCLGMYYMLKDGEELRKELMALSPLPDSDDKAIFDRIRDAVRAVAIGSFSVAIIKGFVGGIIFFALGLQAPVFWGTMIAFTSFIPMAGTALVTVPFAAYLFATGQFWQGLILAITSVAIIGLVDNFVTPQIINARIRIHPMLILLSMLGGLAAFGAVGFFFGPIIMSVAVALLDIYKKEFRSSLNTIGRDH